jgi:hypothetical protein
MKNLTNPRPLEGYNAVRNDETRGELRAAQYVIIELMGYKKLAGRLMQGVAGLLQLDVPVEGGTVTQFINPNSIYRVTIVDREAVAKFAKGLDPLPAIELEVPPRQQFLGHEDWDSRGDIDY